MADTSFTSKALNTALAALAAPISLVGSTAAGVSGVAGTFSYIVTAFNGGESIASTGISYVNGSATGVNVAFTSVAGATDYRLYRSGVGYTGYLYAGRGQAGNFVIDDFSPTVSGYGNYYLGTDTSAKVSRAMGSKATKFYQPSGVRTLFKEAVVTNSFISAVTFNLYVAPSGESPSIGNVLFSSVSLDANETKILSLNTVIGDAGSIWANASETGYIPGYGCVSLKISGIEISDS